MDPEANRLAGASYYTNTYIGSHAWPCPFFMIPLLSPVDVGEWSAFGAAVPREDI